MAISFDKIVGNHAAGLLLREKRGELLASNLVNADTPGYKARDLDFKSVLASKVQSSPSLARTQAGHIAPDQGLFGAEVLYRNPTQVSLDGNTVEAEVEQTKYAENAVRYQASLKFVGDSFAGVITALKGQ
ncbi:MAG: flagellar basal body rod protein FlgB [Methylobacter sp.]|nr:MAG: flagellar basal body rod protein FlgB [Methylobacter sp.]PPD19225.1 MAG: flagellar basal body rod protein FlgB [Methylobacter sp.]PPD36823.1 MAG: flagellar basal body rod protein FlgB [Methylomonas sp.]